MRIFSHGEIIKNDEYPLEFEHVLFMRKKDIYFFHIDTKTWVLVKTADELKTISQDSDLDFSSLKVFSKKEGYHFYSGCFYEMCWDEDIFEISGYYGFNIKPNPNNSRIF